MGVRPSIQKPWGQLFYDGDFPTPLSEIQALMQGNGGGAVPEPAGLGLIGVALLAIRKRRS